MNKVYIVTNASCCNGVYYDTVCNDRESAIELAEKINKQAMRGICDFADVIEEMVKV